MSEKALRPPRPVASEGPLARAALIAVALVFLSLFLFLPLVVVFWEALRNGLGPYVAALAEPDAVSEMWLVWSKHHELSAAAQRFKDLLIAASSGR